MIMIMPIILMFNGLRQVVMGLEKSLTVPGSWNLGRPPEGNMALAKALRRPEAHLRHPFEQREEPHRVSNNGNGYQGLSW